MDLSYSDMEALFRFETSLIAPWKAEQRFHWITERLDLIVEEFQGPKKLYIAEQPAGDQSSSLAPEYQTNVILVKSEEARCRFLQSIGSRRSLEEIKSLHRLALLDRLNNEQSQSPKKTDLTTNKHLDDVKMKLLEKQKAIVKRIIDEKNLATSPVKRATRKAEDIRSSDPQEVPDLSILPCEPTNKVSETRIAIRNISLIIRDSFEKHRKDIRDKARSASEAKYRAWIKLQDDCKLRFEEGHSRQKLSADVEAKRSSNIAIRERERRKTFSETLSQQARDAGLDRKHFIRRVQEAKLRAHRERIRKLIELHQKRVDLEKIELLRNRNIEIKLEVRDRRVKEQRWKKERQQMHVNQQLPPEPLSARSHRTGSSAVSLSKRDREEQASLAIGKAEFLKDLEREERIAKKLTAKGPVTFPQPDRYLLWKQEDNRKREARLQWKLDAEAQKREALRSKREHDIARFVLNAELEELRAAKWRQD